jgi:hypothetical protein
MADTRGVRQELQEQLISAARIVQEQGKKARAQARNAEVQVRRGQDAVSGVVRTLTDTAEALRPQLPTVRIKLPSLPSPSRLPGVSRIAASVKRPDGVKVPSAGALLAGAQETAEHVLAAQRKLADQIAHAAAPLLAQGAARAIQAAQAVLPGAPADAQPAADVRDPAPWDTAVAEAAASARTEAAEVAAAEVTETPEVTAVAASPAAASTVTPAEAQADSARQATAATAAPAQAGSAAKAARTPKPATTAKPAAAKPAAAKPAAAKPAAAKDSAGKPAGTAKAAKPARSTKPAKPGQEAVGGSDAGTAAQPGTRKAGGQKPGPASTD